MARRRSPDDSPAGGATPLPPIAAPRPGRPERGRALLAISDACRPCLPCRPPAGTVLASTSTFAPLWNVNNMGMAVPGVIRASTPNIIAWLPPGANSTVAPDGNGTSAIGRIVIMPPVHRTLMQFYLVDHRAVDAQQTIILRRALQGEITGCGPSRDGGHAYPGVLHPRLFAAAGMAGGEREEGSRGGEEAAHSKLLGNQQVN